MASLESRLDRLSRKEGIDAGRIPTVQEVIAFEAAMLRRLDRLGGRRADNRRDRECIAFLLSMPDHWAKFDLPPDATDDQVMQAGRERGLSRTDLDRLARALEENRLPIEDLASLVFEAMSPR
jgi:hypothetical protein